MFSVHTTSEEFENATINGHFRFVWKMLIGQGNNIVVRSSFAKTFHFKMFSVHARAKRRRFRDSPDLKRAFSKSELRLRDGVAERISVDGSEDGRPNRR